MADAYLGEIRAFAGNYAPAGWLICNGSLQSINNNEALFTLLGTTYGGDGMNTFGLPNLMGRLAIGMGQGIGLTNRPQGSTGGTETVTLTPAQIPAHTHTFTISTGVSSSGAKSSILTPASNTYLGPMYSATGTLVGYLPGSAAGITVKAMNPSVVSSIGGSLPHESRMPYLAINYIICTAGLYPSRS